MAEDPTGNAEIDAYRRFQRKLKLNAEYGRRANRRRVEHIIDLWSHGPVSFAACSCGWHIESSSKVSVSESAEAHRKANKGYIR